MQILHFNWLRYLRAISDNHQVTKFAGFSVILRTYQRSSRGFDPREPPDIYTKTFANSTYLGPIFFLKKPPLSLPRGAEFERALKL